MTSKHQVKPPRLGVWLLESFCSYDFLATALWDMEELFQHHVETKGRLKARWLYMKEAISVIFHLYFKGQSQYSSNNIAMFKNNINLALRNFKKHRSYAVLNVLGLSSGLMIFLLISVYTAYEFSYDGYHENADRTYRVYKSVNTLEELYLDSGTPGLFAIAVQDEFPEVESAVRMSSTNKALVKTATENFLEPELHVADPSVFDIFSLESVTGKRSDFLKDANDVAISESVAMKYFGRTDVLDETLEIYRRQLRISGVFKDMPVNSHFRMNVIMQFQGTRTAWGDNLANWNNNPYYTYITLKENADAEALEAKLPLLREKYADDPIDEDGQSVTYFLQPLQDEHFATDINGSMGDIADADRLYVFGIIALVVLVMAGINYVNLATARAINRMKESGMRKIMGAKRNNLLSQFMVESGMLVFGSLLIALLLANLLLPGFSNFVDRPLAFDFSNPLFWLFLVGLGVIITLLSGIYPALVISSFDPLRAISNRGNRAGKSLMRNSLVVLQFALSAVLIMSAIVLQRQLSYIDNVDTGYTRENVLILSTRDDAVDNKLPTYMEALQQVAGVDAVATSWSLPTRVSSNAQANWPGIEDAQRINMYLLGVTHDFFDLYEIEMAEGRRFDREIKTDRNAMILNEAAVKAFGWEDPIGREMIDQYGDKATVIGVVKDFHIKSLREEIAPLQIVLDPRYATLAVRINGDMANALEDIEAVYESFGPSYPFDFRYFDDVYDQAYADDQKTGELSLVFTFLAIIIACLGLYGLASHKVASRVKELGIRKVMGATARNIAGLLFRDFLVLVGLAFLVAGPVAYYLLNNWLDDFAYHISVGPATFMLTLALLLVFTLITVGYRTYRASVSNPVLALRDE